MEACAETSWREKDVGRTARRTGLVRCLLEPLESRVLLSGVTLVTHGYELSGTFPNWVETMAEAVAAREGGASIYRFVLGGRAGITPHFVADQGPLAAGQGRMV